MNSTLLDKMKKINKILYWTNKQQISFTELSRILSKIIDANVYVLGVNGHLTGFTLTEGYSCKIMERDVLEDNRFPTRYSHELMDIQETRVEASDHVESCVFDEKLECPYKTRYSVIIPINGGGERLGTFLMTRFDKEFCEEDVVLGEHSATVVALEILHYRNQKTKEEAREKAVVQMAMATLSYSELEAMDQILRELNGKEGLLIASKIADRAGITRSVIVNAMRKFASAGVIESRSLGMKGTYIKILNDNIIEEMKRYRN